MLSVRRPGESVGQLNVVLILHTEQERMRWNVPGDGWGTSTAGQEGFDSHEKPSTGTWLDLGSTPSCSTFFNPYPTQTTISL